MCLEAESAEPIPLETSRLKPEEWAVFFDESHGIGSDIKQKRDVKRTVTLSENLLLKDPQQAIWRMREVDKAQTPIYLFTRECQQNINAMLGKKPLDEIVPEDVLTYPGHEPSDMLGRRYRPLLEAYGGRCDVEQRVSPCFASGKRNPLLAQDIFNVCDIENLFTTPHENKPFEQFGQIETLRPSLTVLEEFKKDWLERFDKTLKAKLEDATASQELKTHLRSIQEKVHKEIDDLGFPDADRIPRGSSRTPTRSFRH